MKPISCLTKLAIAVAIMLPVVIPTHAQEDMIEVVAAAVRDKGYICDQPQSMERDQAQSTDLEAVWLIHCEFRTFRVKFLGDAGTQVEPVN